MKIILRALWRKKGDSLNRSFKLPGALNLIEEYIGRINRFCDFNIEGGFHKGEEKDTARTVWFCDRAAGAKILSSEALASELQKVQDRGIPVLHIVIGGPDGFQAADYDLWRPALRWSFGPLTLPHELAAAIACEQLYRGFTILKKQPYHLGH